MDESDNTSSELAEQLRRWLVIAGYILGGWAIFSFALLTLTWGLPFNRGFRMSILMLIDRIASAAYILAPPLLIAGCWGFQRHRRWARPVLLTYAGMWIAGVVGLRVVQFIDTLSGAYGDLTLAQVFSTSVGGFDLTIYSSVFPVLLALCLLRPEIRDCFPEFRSGFPAIVAPESNQ